MNDQEPSRAVAPAGSETKSKPSSEYLALFQRFHLRPLRTDAELDHAIAIIDELIVRRDLTPGERDYLDVLSDLVHRYETSAYPIREA